MQTTFQDFLEAKITPIVPEHLSADAEAIKQLIKTECSESVWMLENKLPLWCGDRKTLSRLGPNGMAIINTELSTRKSEDMSNWYTLIIDNKNGCICSISRKLVLRYENV